MRFARRHEDRLPSLGEKTTWWLRLFVKGGFGPEAEDERKRIARHWLLSGVAFFALAAAAQWLYRAG